VPPRSGEYEYDSGVRIRKCFQEFRKVCAFVDDGLEFVQYEDSRMIVTQ
jgi:hypothetical protein